MIPGAIVKGLVVTDGALLLSNISFGHSLSIDYSFKTSLISRGVGDNLVRYLILCIRVSADRILRGEADTPVAKLSSRPSLNGGSYLVGKSTVDVLECYEQKLPTPFGAGIV